MKSLKSILPLFAFVIAVVTAFASETLLVSAKGIHPESGCITGNLVPPPANKVCSVTTSGNRCQVEIPNGLGTITVPAFSMTGSCPSTQELYYPN